MNFLYLGTTEINFIESLGEGEPLMYTKDDIRIITFWSAIHQTVIRGVNDSPQARFGSDLYGTVYLLSDIYGSRIVPGKKYILSGGRHLIMWRPPLNYVAAAT